MNDRDQSFYNSFLAPADPFIFARETIITPRTTSALIYQVNTNTDLARGEKRRGFALNNIKAHGWNSKLKQRTGTPFNSIRAQIQRQHYWHHLHYSDDALLDWIYFDVDCHTVGAEQDYQQQVYKINQLVQSVGGSVVWTTSPGRMYFGQHLRGAYAWIKLSNRWSVRALKAKINTARAMYGITAESFDTNRLVRMPGQKDCEVCEPKTRTILYPAQKNTDTLAYFAQAWSEAPAARLDQLISSTPPTQHQRAIYAPVEDTEQLRAMPNTFDRACASKIFSRLTLQYQADSKDFDRAVQQSENYLLDISPVGSKTIGDPITRNQFCSRLMKWYFQNFDPCKAISKRAKEDKARFAGHILTDDIFAKTCKAFGLSSKAIRVCSELYLRAKKWNGRVAYQIRYTLAGGRRAWFSLIGQISKVFDTLDQYDYKESKCRQYGLQEAFITKAHWLTEAVKTTNKLLRQQQQTAATEILAVHPSLISTTLSHNPYDNHSTDSTSDYYFDEIDDIFQK